MSRMLNAENVTEEWVNEFLDGKDIDLDNCYSKNDLNIFMNSNSSLNTINYNAINEIRGFRKHMLYE